MNPDLVDASLRLKSLKSRKMMSTEPITIDNLQPLVNTGILSDVLRDISNESLHNNFLPQSTDNFLTELSSQEVFLVQGSFLPDQHLHSNNTVLSSEFTERIPDTPLLPDSPLLPDNPLLPALQHHVHDNGDVQAGFDILMDDSMNAPESVMSSEFQETLFYNNQISVIVENINEPLNKSKFDVPNSNSDIINLKKNAFEQFGNEVNGEMFAMRASDDEEEVIKNTFDIETLVDECFVHLYEGPSK